MGYATYVGRVGALAVALGIGTAVITTPGIALADDGTTGSDTTNNSTNGGETPGGGGVTTGSAPVGDAPEGHVGSSPATGVGVEGGNNTGGGTSGTTTITVGGGPEVVFNTQTTVTGTTSSTAKTGTGTVTNPTPTPEVDPVLVAPTSPETATLASIPADLTSEAPTSSAPVFPSNNTDPAANPTLTPVTGQGSSTPPVAGTLHDLGAGSGPSLVGVPSLARTFNAVAAPNDVAALANPTVPYALPNPPVVSTPPIDPIAALIALPGNLLSFAVDLISAALTPFFTGVPSAPADTPVLWAVLAFVRRQFFNTSPVLAPSGQVADPTTGQLYGLIGAADADGDPLTYAVLQGPAHGAVAVDAAGAYVYTPTAGYVGADSFTVAVSDVGAHVHGLNGLLSPYGGHATVATIGLTAVGANPGANTAPTITAVPVTTDPSTGVIRYTVTTTDSPGDTVTVTATVANPTRGSIVADPATTGVYVYTPNAAYAHGLALGGSTVPGGDTITFKATDAAGASATATANPVINPVNHAPTLSVVTEPTGAANGAIKVTITFADADTDILTASTVALTHGGLYTSQAGGTPIPTGGTNISPDPVGPVPTTQTAYYIPNPAQPGTDTLSFTLSDAYGGTITVSKPIVVTAPGVNQNPTVNITAGAPGTDGTVLVSVNVLDPEDDAFTVFYPVDLATGTLTYLDGQDTFDDEDGSYTQYYEYMPYLQSRIDAYANEGEDTEVLFFDVSDTDDDEVDYETFSVPVTISPLATGNGQFVITTPTNGMPNQADGGVTGSFLVTSPDGGPIDAFVADQDQPAYGSVDVMVAPTAVNGIYTVSYVYTPDPLARLDAFSGGPTEDTFAVTITGAASVARFASFARAAAPLADADTPTTVPVTVPVAPANSVVLGTWPNASTTANAVVTSGGVIYQPYLTTNGMAFVGIFGSNTPVPIEGSIQSIRAVGSNAVVMSTVSGTTRSVISVVTSDGQVTAFDAPAETSAGDLIVSDGVAYLQNQYHLYRVTSSGVSADLFPSDSTSSQVVGNAVYYTKNIGTNSLGLYKVGSTGPIGTFTVDATHTFYLYGGANGYLYAATRAQPTVAGGGAVQTLYKYESASNVPATFNVANAISVSLNNYGVAPDGTLFLAALVGPSRYATHFSPGANSFSPLQPITSAGFTISTVYGPSSAYSLQSVSNGSAAPTILVVNLFNGATSAPIAGYAPTPIKVGLDGNAYLTVVTGDETFEVWRVEPNGASTVVSTGDYYSLSNPGNIAVGADGSVYISTNVGNAVRLIGARG